MSTIRPMGISAGRRDLVAASAAVIVLSTLVEGPAIPVVAALLALAVALATLQILADGVPSTASAGVPIEALILPAVAAVGVLGSIRLVPVGALLVPALLIGAWLLDRTLAVEARLLASPGSPSTADRTAVMGIALVAAFAAFVAVAVVAPGGLPEPGRPDNGPAGLGLALLAGADGVFGFLLGYRAAALRTVNLRDALWAGLTSGAAIAIAAGGLRVLALPRLVGPALLVVVFFLWDAVHASAPTRRGTQRRIWEALILVGVGIAVAAWSLRLEA